MVVVVAVGCREEKFEDFFEVFNLGVALWEIPKLGISGVRLDAVPAYGQKTSPMLGRVLPGGYPTEHVVSFLGTVLVLPRRYQWALIHNKQWNYFRKIHT